MSAAREVRARLRRGAYLLPSLFTIGNIFLGFAATIHALHGHFVRAGAYILVASVLDFLDGKIARMTGTESDFGREFDSLADVLTFGMAPALAAWAWGLSDLRRAGWLVPLFFVVCTATRLARFNVQAARTDTRWFVGLPAPAAAGTVASFLLVGVEPGWRPWFVGAMAGGLVVLGLLMVSTFRFWSLKALDLGARWSYRVALPIAAVVLLLAFWPELFFPGFAVLYVASGPLHWLFSRILPASRADDTRQLPPAPP
ncbi:MAG: CDP-diacylglycerol--serine O-phosphatidyltransferase [Thermoanaerobaculia bacterium]|nr:MAG: CDP-diacylglycerol--serine O-phosphatidyltransferase [Thermoanaerobaculia bacterium]